MAAKTLNLGDLIGALAIAGQYDTATLLKILEQELVGATKRNFLQEQDPDGNPWAKLKRPRRNSKGRDRILQDTGALRTSVTAKGARGNIDLKTPTSLTWGTNLHYAKFHQDGTKHIPKREFLGIGEKLAEKMEAVAYDYIEEQINRAFGGM